MRSYIDSCIKTLEKIDLHENNKISDLEVEESKAQSPTDYTTSMTLTQKSAIDADVMARGYLADESTVRLPVKSN